MRAAFTIITTNYISYAKTLGDSIIKYNPEYTFFICLIGKMDDLDKTVDMGGFEIIEHELLSDKIIIDSMQLRYDPFELSCALKPFFADHILKNKDIHRLKYIDSDIMVFNSFDKDIEANRTSSIFLTPHFFIPVAPDELNTTNDILLLKSGIYNAGYFELANTKITRDFLNWWKDRLSKYCYYFKPPFTQVFVDQSWLNFVPIYFNDTLIIDHLGYNTSFFNLHERKISKQNDIFLINENKPMIFFHFTGYKYYEHENVSMHNSKYNFKNTLFLEAICNQYRKSLIENRIERTLPPPDKNKKTHMSFFNLTKEANKLLEKFFKLKIVRT